MSSRLKTLIGLVITVVLLWWVLRDVSPSEVWTELRAANPWMMIAAVVAATFSFVLRAFRWRVLLEPEHDGTDFDTRFGATCAGFAANNVLPARLGEFVRAFVLSSVGRIPLGGSIGSLVVERVLDGLVLAFLLSMTILLPDFPLGESSAAGLVQRTAVVGAAVFLAGFAFLGLAARRPDGTLQAWDRSLGRLVPRRFSARVRRLVDSFVRGLRALSTPVVFVRALGWTVAVWICLAASIWLGLLAFNITAPGFAGAIFLQAMIAFAVAAPSTPGFFGVFEAASRLGLGVWDVPEAAMVGFATSYHILTFIPVTVLGLLYLRRVGLRLTDLSRGRGVDS
ncbi:MAG: flippase-like domain-containing protein [Gemmatimonadota bacterium]|nr:flippase-like domain-containing protein [Gemmatimonadota bacterium]